MIPSHIISLLLLYLFRLSNQAADTEKLLITSLHMDTVITSRFATTYVTSSVLNLRFEPRQSVFRITLPNSAFISNFTMLVSGKLIVGEVDSKAKAQERFDEARAKGESAGLVSKQPRETNIFEISVNVAANDKVSFNLTYQEVLVRAHGVYKQVLNISPGQIVPDMRLSVVIREREEIVKLIVPRIDKTIGEKTNKELLSAKKNEDVKIVKREEGNWRIAELIYELDKLQQEQFSTKGIHGQFVVLYDVEHNNDGGDIQVVNGYFVHFFAPQNLEVGHKSIVFILDKSGSMSGEKIQQLKEAMSVILNDLNEGDVFNIVAFSTLSSNWLTEFVPATEDWKSRAVDFVNNLQAAGSTDINGALQTGVQLLNKDTTNKLAKMIVFLTDGLPSAGITDHESILNNLHIFNEGKDINIHAISFGEDADYALTRKIATRNAGLARKVYEDSDAALQLEGFYKEIASPLLSNLNIKYLNESVEPNSISLSDDSAVYYEGGEVVVTGRLKEGKYADKQNTAQLSAVVSGKGTKGTVSYDVIEPYCPCICPWSRAHAHIQIHSHRTARHIINLPCNCPLCPFPQPLPAEQEPESNPNSFGGFVERMWAYSTIQKLLNEANFGTSNTQEQEKLRKEALDMSLKYNFVTELTSLVVTQDSKKMTLSDRGEKSTTGGSSGGHSLFSAGGGGLGTSDDILDGILIPVTESTEESMSDTDIQTTTPVPTVGSSSMTPTTKAPPTAPTPNTAVFVHYAIAALASFSISNQTSHVKTVHHTLNDCALECAGTIGCTMVFFDPSSVKEKCYLIFQAAVDCSDTQLTTLSYNPTTAIVVNCILTHVGRV